jgi:hypothetical protein
MYIVLGGYDYKLKTGGLNRDNKKVINVVPTPRLTTPFPFYKIHFL